MENEPGFGDRVKVFSDDSNACGSITRLVKGKSAEMHFHLTNDKVVYILSGTVEMAVIKDGVYKHQILAPGASVSIKAGVVHQLKAVEDSIIVEFGTNPRTYDLDGKDVHIIDNGSILTLVDDSEDDGEMPK